MDIPGMIGRRVFMAASAAAAATRAQAAELAGEAPLLPDLEIVDPHHHQNCAPATATQPA